MHFLFIFEQIELNMNIDDDLYSKVNLWDIMNFKSMVAVEPHWKYEFGWSLVAEETKWFLAFFDLIFEAMAFCCQAWINFLDRWVHSEPLPNYTQR